MVEGSIAIRVLTEAGVALEDRAVSVVAPGEIGYLGMLRNHAPLVTTLQPGKLTWRKADGQARVAEIGDGLLEITHNQLTILTKHISEMSVTVEGAQHE